MLKLKVHKVPMNIFTSSMEFMSISTKSPSWKKMPKSVAFFNWFFFWLKNCLLSHYPCKTNSCYHPPIIWVENFITLLKKKKRNSKNNFFLWDEGMFQNKRSSWPFASLPIENKSVLKPFLDSRTNHIFWVIEKIMGEKQNRQWKGASSKKETWIFLYDWIVRSVCFLWKRQVFRFGLPVIPIS